ncbi:MAG: class I SAM-dependent methyltransferase [Phycisphaeraceae bacterium]|nr:class I SAM-dependent methyltransferase [Phycisphaeraceae bacterium]
MTDSRRIETDTPPLIGVCADPPKDINLLKAAARLAVDLSLPFLEKPTRTHFEMLLVVSSDRLALRVLKGDPTIKGGNPVSVDLLKVDTTSGAGRSLSQPIAKAVGLKKRSDLPLTVIDTTAGWGEDAWLLASLGCSVLTCERNKIMATLLRDGLFRAGAEHPDVLSRLHLVQTDARHMLRRIARGGADPETPGSDLPPAMQDFLQPDVVFLDPMFPDSATRKTAERKPMKVARRLVGDDLDAGELFDWAILVARKRVVVKRPLKAGPLRDKPTTSHKGKSLRYDIYVPKIMSTR